MALVVETMVIGAFVVVGRIFTRHNTEMRNLYNALATDEGIRRFHEERLLSIRCGHAVCELCQVLEAS